MIVAVQVHSESNTHSTQQVPSLAVLRCCGVNIGTASRLMPGYAFNTPAIEAAFRHPPSTTHLESTHLLVRLILQSRLTPPVGG